MRGILPALVLILLAAATASGQGRDLPPAEEKGTYLGVLVSPVPEVLYDHVPELPRGEGVVVAHVLPDSPAARADLRRNDILLRFDDEKVRDGEHLTRLINGHKPDEKVPLVLLRGGKKVTADATLTLGPVLKIAGPGVPPDPSKGTAKAGGPPPEVSVSAAPLDGGRLKLTIEYYQEAQGRVRSVSCDGTPAELATKVTAMELPTRVRDLTQVALKRINDLDLQKVEAKSRPPAPRPSRRQP
jgi:membrane-associated protease RseP (regulator of RpoE activity)